MKITQKIFVILGLSLMIPMFAHADENLQQHIANKAMLANRAFQKASAVMVDGAGSAPEPGSITYTQFFLGFVPTATFGINSILSISVSPEITFIWEKIDPNKYKH